MLICLREHRSLFAVRLELLCFSGAKVSTEATPSSPHHAVVETFCREKARKKKPFERFHMSNFASGLQHLNMYRFPTEHRVDDRLRHSTVKWLGACLSLGKFQCQ